MLLIILLNLLLLIPVALLRGLLKKPISLVYSIPIAIVLALVLLATSEVLGMSVNALISGVAVMSVMMLSYGYSAADKKNKDSETNVKEQSEELNGNEQETRPDSLKPVASNGVNPVIILLGGFLMLMILALIAFTLPSFLDKSDNAPIKNNSSSTYGQTKEAEIEALRKEADTLREEADTLRKEADALRSGTKTQIEVKPKPISKKEALASIRKLYDLPSKLPEFLSTPKISTALKNQTTRPKVSEIVSPIDRRAAGNLPKENFDPISFTDKPILKKEAWFGSADFMKYYWKNGFLVGIEDIGDEFFNITWVVTYQIIDQGKASQLTQSEIYQILNLHGDSWREVAQNTWVSDAEVYAKYHQKQAGLVLLRGIKARYDKSLETHSIDESMQFLY